jgi:hypothetical protein
VVGLALCTLLCSEAALAQVAPVFTSSPDLAVDEGSLYSYTMTATDDDGDPLTFDAPTLPAWLSFNGTDTISGTPGQAQVGGGHNVTVTVSDGSGPAVTYSYHNSEIKDECHTE